MVWQPEEYEVDKDLDKNVLEAGLVLVSYAD